MGLQFAAFYRALFLDGARDIPADGGNAKVLDTNHHKTQQKMGQDWMYMYTAEYVSYYFHEHGRRGVR